MRFSSIVALVVVTASFALGGCAADAEPADLETGDNVALEGNSGEDRTADLRLLPNRADERTPSFPIEARAHVFDDKGTTVDPRVETQPPAFVHGGRNRVVVSPEQMKNVVDAHTTGSPKP